MLARLSVLPWAACLRGGGAGFFDWCGAGGVAIAGSGGGGAVGEASATEVGSKVECDDLIANVCDVFGGVGGRGVGTASSRSKLSPSISPGVFPTVPPSKILSVFSPVGQVSDTGRGLLTSEDEEDGRSVTPLLLPPPFFSEWMSRP